MGKKDINWDDKDKCHEQLIIPVDQEKNVVYFSFLGET